MLSLQASSTRAKCNLLPCRIKYTGPTEATEKHWRVIGGEDGTRAASFRGRKLVGKSIPAPVGYQGHILEATSDRLVSEGEHSTPPNNQEVSDEEVNIFKGLSTFDEITIWGHDATPDESTDGVIRGIGEWIGFADKIHCFSMDDGTKEAASK